MSHAAHRFHTLPRILILQLKRFKVDMQLQILRKIHERVAWEKELDISELCLPDVLPPAPLPEPEREVANQVAAEIASSDPGHSLGDSFDPKQLDDDDSTSSDVFLLLCLY